MSLTARYFLFLTLAVTLAFFLLVATLSELEKDESHLSMLREASQLMDLAESTQNTVQDVVHPLLKVGTPRLVLEASSGALFTRLLFRRFSERNPRYTFRQPSLNPLNPLNRPSDTEAEMINRFRGDPYLTELADLRTIGNESFFQLARPIKSDERCLACHGEPKSAPIELTERYTTGSGFGWPTDEVIGMNLISIPTQDLQNYQRNRASIILFGLGIMAFSLLGIGHWLFRRLVTKRLFEAAAVLEEVQRDPTGRRRLRRPGTDEIGQLGQGVNRVADALRDYRAEVAFKIEEKTQALSREAELLREREVAALEAKGLMEKCLAMAGGILVATDTQGRITLINRRGCRILGYEEHELLGRDWFATCIPEESRDAERAAFDRAATKETPPVTAVEGVVVTREGKTLLISWNALPLRSPQGKWLGVVSSGEEVTALRRLEKELSQTREKAEAANESKSLFLAAMSHEIRTPMSAIIGIGELLGDTPLDAKQQRFVEVLTRNGEVLLALIDNILDLSRAENSRIEFRQVPVNLETLASEVVETTRVLAREKRLAVTQSLAEELVLDRLGDPVRLRQILLNLLGNAVKFTQVGSITLSVKDEEDHPGYVQFSVQDTGQGIPREKRDVIFEPFVQADDIASHLHGGVGLGLAICKKLVTQMGGWISVASDLGRGSRFLFSLPLPVQEGVSKEIPPPDNQTDAPPEEELIAALAGRRFLLVEDSEDNVMLVEGFLQGTDCQLVVAENGLAALEWMAKPGVTFDVVLMDMQMPMMDGYTASRKIRKWEQRQHRRPVPILALTAHALPEDREKSLASGCNAHLTKPIRKRRLLENIVRHLQPMDAEGSLT
ncbi:MAG: DUF3365 domain-containing protein [Magnetococcales bacterium]|nr:DUF3365 domain-containing protein [Magnetococcales bacterium]